MAREITRPHQATRWIETSCGILSYAQLAPLLAERVLGVQQRLESGDYANLPLDDELVSRLHGDFCGDLVPDWAGRWRTMEVRIGSHQPPAPHLVPQLMREYAGNLQARLAEPIDPELTPEHLAYAESRLLTIHPFRDFNGRLVRLLLWEILRRLSLPPVDLVPNEPADIKTYLSALGAGDTGDLRPLIVIWRKRLAYMA